MDFLALFHLCSVIVIALLFRALDVNAQDLGSIRLSGGSSDSSGTLQIYYEGQWGTVCHDGFEECDATVVCRQLGFNSVAEITKVSNQQGSIVTWLDDVQCSGYENRLYDCPHPPWGEVDCLGEYVAVSCSSDVTPEPLDWNVNGDVRLKGGVSDSQGRVEVYYDGSWNTICDDLWDLNDARVVCRQLGYYGVREAPRSSFFGQGTGRVLLEDLRCYGYEDNLLNCPHDGYYDTDCSHSRDAGVICAESGPYQGEARLVGSNFAGRGRVEIYNQGQWGTVCDDRFGSDDANVICRQLGFGKVVARYSGGYYGWGTGPIMWDLDCRGSEWKWGDCPFDEWGTARCDHFDDVGLYCLDKVSANMEGKVRLAGKAPSDSSPPAAMSAYYGRTEIFHYDEWGTICDDYWDFYEADVVCRQLGFPAAFAAAGASFYGSGPGPIMLDDVRCDGREHYLTQCGHNAWYWHNCAQNEDAGVRCVIPVNNYPRLVDGDRWYEGRIEVWRSGEWQRLCATNFYDQQAKTICQQLGFVGYDWYRFDNLFGVGDADPIDVGFYCTEGEYTLSRCDTFNINEKDFCGTVDIRCNNAGHMSAGAICGIVFSCLLGVAIIGACVATMVRSRKNRNQRIEETEARQQTQPPPPQTVFQPAPPPAYSDVPYNASLAYPPPQPAAYPPTQPAAYPPTQPAAYPPTQPAAYPPAQPVAQPPQATYESMGDTSAA